MGRFRGLSEGPRDLRYFDFQGLCWEGVSVRSSSACCSDPDGSLKAVKSYKQPFAGQNDLHTGQ